MSFHLTLISCHHKNTLQHFVYPMQYLPIQGTLDLFESSENLGVTGINYHIALPVIARFILIQARTSLVELLDLEMHMNAGRPKVTSK